MSKINNLQHHRCNHKPIGSYLVESGLVSQERLLQALEEQKKTEERIGDILVRQIENEAILLHIPTGTYLSLSETSIPFWEALQNKQTLKGIVEQIVSEYEVEHSKVIADLENFLTDLLKFKIIRESLDVSGSNN